MVGIAVSVDVATGPVVMRVVWVVDVWTDCDDVAELGSVSVVFF